MWGPTQNAGSIGLAVLTFIGYKQTNRHPYKQYRYGNFLQICFEFEGKYYQTKYLNLKKKYRFRILI